MLKGRASSSQIILWGHQFERRWKTATEIAEKNMAMKIQNEILYNILVEQTETHFICNSYGIYRIFKLVPGGVLIIP